MRTSTLMLTLLRAHTRMNVRLSFSKTTIQIIASTVCGRASHCGHSIRWFAATPSLSTTSNSAETLHWHDQVAQIIEIATQRVHLVSSFQRMQTDLIVVKCRSTDLAQLLDVHAPADAGPAHSRLVAAPRAMLRS
jgi:hypothetical protein